MGNARSEGAYQPCCGCCPTDDAACQFNPEPNRHTSLCPVCEVECPCCGDTHPPTTQFLPAARRR